MSLLKSLFDMVFKSAADSIINSEPQPAKPAPAPQAKPQPAREPAARDHTAYFAEILSSEFPQYTTQHNVKVTDLAGFATDEVQLYKTRPRQEYKAEWGEPYTFVLYQGATPKGIVMLGAGDSHSRKVKYLISRMYAKKMGLPYINFYTQMPNERDYVVERIEKFMKA